MDVLTAMRNRRSIGRLVEPAPSEDHLRQILESGALAPDHGELRPFRFHLLRGPALHAFGVVLEAAYTGRCQSRGEAPVEAKAAKERTKLTRAPLVVVVSAVHQDGAIPWLEQQQAAAAACQNILLAATALGYGSMWRTGDPVYDPMVKTALGLRSEDAIAGFLYLGTVPDDASVAKGPKQPDLNGLVEEWSS